MGPPDLAFFEAGDPEWRPPEAAMSNLMLSSIANGKPIVYEVEPSANIN
jgi:hypothetical protein